MSRLGELQSDEMNKSLVTKIGTRLVLIVLVGTTIGCDRVTKHLASTTLAGAPPRSLLADTVRLDYTENTGGFLSLGAELPVAARTALFTVVTGLSLLVMIVMAIQSRRSVWSLIGLSLFIAGGASNWLDRLAFGRVVDFINVGFGPVRTGIFNVADVTIMFGAGLLILTEMRRVDRPTVSGEPTN
jgi:signal peptidase II